MDNKNKPHLSKKDSELFIAGIQIAVCFVLCGGVGYYADLKCHSFYKYTEWGIVIGFVSGIGNFIKAIIGALNDKR